MEIHKPEALRLWRGLAIAFALFVIATNILCTVYDFEGLTQLGTLGGQLTPVPANEPGIQKASAVKPGSPLARAGVAENSLVRLDNASDAIRHIWAGEQIGVTLVDAKPPRHAEITAALLAPGERLHISRLLQIDSLSALLASAVGLIILLRAGGTLSLIVLGLAFAGFNYTTGTPLQENAATFPAWETLRIIIHFFTPLLFLDFALRFYQENVGPLARWVRPLFWVATLVTLITAIDAGLYNIVGVVSGIADSKIPAAATGVIFLAAIAAFVMGWRRSQPALQRRYAIMLVALSCFIASALTMAAAHIVTGIYDLRFMPFGVQVAFEVLATAAPLLFSYAVLRHKVVDLGFAVNRALVYGVVSTVLLVIFGVVEWASEHFLPIKDLETNALIDGGIALTIFLVFHRLRDLSEHVIEGLFFRQWRENEAALRRFVKEAAFIGTKKALGKAIIAEWTRFSGGAACALYLAGTGRDFMLYQGVSATVHVDGDDPLIVALRTYGEPVELSDTQSLLPGALALPMRHRGELTGFVLMAEKTSGDPHRPDEQELLGWAAHQTGLDLQALESEHLHDDVLQLRQECARLTAQLDLVRELGLKTPNAVEPG